MDYFPGEITIGGAVPAALVVGLCQAVNAQGVGLEWGVEGLIVADAAALRAAVDGHGHLWLCDSSATGGMFEELEEFLQAHDLPYDRRSDAFGGEYDGELICFRPGGEPREFVTDSDGCIVVPRATVQSALAQLAVEDGAGARALLEAAIGQDLPALPAFTVEETEEVEAHAPSIG
jgi:hypothetical protein